MAEGARCRQVEIMLDELDAVHHVMARTNPGDIVVLCVDKHATVLAELEARTQHAQPGARAGESIADPDLDPANLTETAEAEGTEADEEALGAAAPDASLGRADDTAV
jgi:cyanophycin synthetase